MSINANPPRPLAMTSKSLADTRPATATIVRPALLLFLSGIAALIFQVIWIKQLTLIVGVEVHAIAAAVSAFFGGLALGGLLFGRMADRKRRPLRLYAGLEIGSAALALAATLVLGSFAPVFADMESHVGALPAWALVFVIVGAPAVLMGGTLPAMVAAIARGGAVSRVGGVLYAANTTGAIVGALAPAFLLIPALGVRGTACAAAVLYVVAGLGALALDRGLPAVARVQRERAAAAPLSRQAWTAIALYALAGAVALGYEIVWSQAIVQFMSTRAFAFSIVLATYLAGLALGAAVFARLAPQMRHPQAWFGCLIAGAGLLALLGFTVLGPWLVYAQSFAEAMVYRATLSEFAGMCARFAVASLFVVLPATLLLGAALPALLAVVADHDRESGPAGRGVGFAVGLNTLGGIFGSLVAGFALVPALGLVRTLVVLALLAAAVGIAALFLLGRSPNGARLAIAGIAVAIIGAALLTPANLLAGLLTGARGGGDLVFYEEGHGGTVAVIARGEGDHRFRRLYIQGVSNSGDAMPSLRYMRLQALLPLIIHTGQPKAALVIGYGTGITAGALSRFPGLEKRVVAELLPAVLRAGPHFSGTFNAPTAPGLEVRLRDGRRELQASTERYDLITLEPPPPSAAGIVNLYSRDFYRLAGARLNANGMVAQWLPLPTQNEDDTRALVRSFTDVFPYAALWTTELHETLLVGSYDPIALDLPTIRRRLSDPKLASALSEVGVDSAEALLATYVTNRAGLMRFAGDVPPVTDDRPAIEYASWVERGVLNSVLPDLYDQRTDPPVDGADVGFRNAVQAQRAELDTFYRAGLSAYAGDRPGWAREMRALSEAGADDNPYFRWFMGARQ